VLSLVSHRFPVERASHAYDLLASPEPSLGILLEYAAPSVAEPGPRAGGARPSHTVALGGQPSAGPVRVAFLGTGNYAGRTLIPAFKAAGASLHTTVSELGVSALHYGRKFGFAQASTDVDGVLASREVDTVVIATRHSSHARLALAALRAHKHVFVEKPLCLTLEELDELERELLARPRQRLMVGFNRRFAPLVLTLKSWLAPLDEPKSLVMTVNAGALPGGHWTVDPDVGGGRLVGEGCHFIDLLRHLAGAPIVAHAVRRVRRAAPERGRDDVTLTLEFADGSLGTIVYLSSGHKGFPKERLEVFCAGRVASLDNFRSLRGWGYPGLGRQHALQQDKGQFACARAFVAALVSGGPAPIALTELLEVSRVSILAERALAS
jgi:predicted dehydrogenase